MKNIKPAVEVKSLDGKFVLQIGNETAILSTDDVLALIHKLSKV